MKQYTDVLERIRYEGRRKTNRTGVTTLSISGPSMTFMMDDGFPLETARPIFFRGIVEENLWFIDGKCNNEDLLAKGVNIWNAWALPEDVTREVYKNLPEVVTEFVEIRRKQQEERGEEVNYEYQHAVQELTKADHEDREKGLPVMDKPLDAKTEADLMGGQKLLRDAGIALKKIEVLWPKGYLGPIYGVLWRRWLDHNQQRIDQLANIMGKLASDNPKLRYSRANIITSFNPAVLPDETVSAQENVQNGRQALAACHTMFQLLAEPMTLEERYNWHFKDAPDAAPFASHNAEALEQFLDEAGVAKDQLTLIMYQRSADFPVGVPFNIAGYALLLHMFSAQLNMKPYQFTHHFGDAHIYEDQLDGVDELLSRVRSLNGELPALPKLWINPEVKSIYEYKFEDFRLDGYAPLKPQIKFPVAV